MNKMQPLDRAKKELENFKSIHAKLCLALDTANYSDLKSILYSLELIKEAAKEVIDNNENILADDDQYYDCSMDWSNRTFNFCEKWINTIEQICDQLDETIQVQLTVMQRHQVVSDDLKRKEQAVEIFQKELKELNKEAEFKNMITDLTEHLNA